jgi:hypothetical protein
MKAQCLWCREIFQCLKWGIKLYYHSIALAMIVLERKRTRFGLFVVILCYSTNNVFERWSWDVMLSGGTVQRTSHSWSFTLCVTSCEVEVWVVISFIAICWSSLFFLFVAFHCVSSLPSFCLSSLSPLFWLPLSTSFSTVLVISFSIIHSFLFLHSGCIFLHRLVISFSIVRSFFLSFQFSFPSLHFLFTVSSSHLNANAYLKTFISSFSSITIPPGFQTALGMNHGKFREAYNIAIFRRLLDPEILFVVPSSSPLGLFCMVVCET